MKYQILGLAGQQGAGKDYTYDRIAAMLDGVRPVRRMAFADGVRREVTLEVIDALGVEIGETDGAGQWQKPYTEGQRWLLQQWGTEFRRAQDSDYWVKYGLDYIKERANPGDLWVVTDVRFANEHQAISRLKIGLTTLVSANPEVRAQRLGITPEELEARSQHASEVIDFKTSTMVHNHGDLVLPERLLVFLGLPPNCIHCAMATQHIWHNNGEATGWMPQDALPA